jgi:hypothetical protein
MKKKQAQRISTITHLQPSLRRRLDRLAVLQNRSLSNQLELILAETLEHYEKAAGLQPSKQ